MKQNLHVGVDYYPEHWPRDRWAQDARLMKEAGFTVVRLAEFNWCDMEPEEGVYDFRLWDDALDVLGAHGLSVILCTPTAVMPAWLARMYPEALATKKDGTRIVWGVRKNNCYSVESYRRLSRGITQAMADHFAQRPEVIGWQTDNEFGEPVCYCDTCRRDFQEWLQARYGTLEALNAAWGTHFWGHRYRDWEEIPIPVDPVSCNPGACLDWQRHHSFLVVRFQQEQVDILRRTCSGHFITHNLMGLAPDVNYFDLAAPLDFASFDNYPVWGAPAIRYEASLAADLMRGVRRKNFWIMEQTAGPCGWGEFGRNPLPGEIRSVAYQQLAHGADGQVWFRWRTCTAGREQYWHGLLGHDGRPLRRYEEARQTAGEYHRLAATLCGTTVRTQVAMLYDYDSLWALRIQPGFKGASHAEALQRFYRALFRAGVNTDVVPLSADLSAYRVVFAPALHVLPDDDARRLAAFVRQGGVLVTDCRTAVKDGNNLCHERTLPGLLSDTLGIEIQEYSSIPADQSHEVEAPDGQGGPCRAIRYADWTRTHGAACLARFTEPFLKDYAVLTRNPCGEGAAYYVGAVIEEDSFYDRVAALALRDGGIEPLLVPPAGVEVSTREGEGRRIVFLLNHTAEDRVVPLPPGKPELISGKTSGAAWTLEPFGVAAFLW